jgi:uroporphyrinogen III methyltransferase/synthase
VLETADVVVYDYLANKSFLDFCRPDAVILYVGKKGGDHTLPRTRSHRLLVEKAKEGKVVARLKGGDPTSSAGGPRRPRSFWTPGWTSRWCPG